MNLKKIKIISVFGIFALSFLCHFMYNWIPNTLFSIFFPVNESIWEHMKIIVTSTLLYSIIEHYLLKKNNISYNNFLFSILTCSILGIIIYLIIYLPIYSILGENMIVSIALLFIVYSIVGIISYKLLNMKDLLINKYVCIIGIIIIYFIFGYLTYKPIKNYIFYDIKENKYGINIYK